jgi:uncharacterized protein (DUF58 family)
MLSTGRLLYLNFRFLHTTSKWLRHRFSSAGFLLLSGLVASGVFGIDTRASLAYQIFSICLSILIIAILSSLMFRGNFSFRRQLPEYGTVTFPLNYKVTINNLNKSPHRDLTYVDELSYKFPSYELFKSTRDPEDARRNWVDRKIGYPRLMSLLQKSRGGSLSWIDIDLIPAEDEIEVTMNFVPLRRGYLYFSKSSIARPDPFGLFRAIISKNNPEKILILPKTYQVPQIRLKGHRKYQQGGINQASFIGDSQEFMSLRDYQPGDPMRSIHWRSYAKRSEPVVKEFRDEFFVRQGLILDTFIEDKSAYQFEEAVSMAASFATTVEDQDSLLDLMFVGTKSYRFTSGRSFDNAANMLELLACVTPCYDKDFVQLVELTGKHISELSGMIIILLDWDDKRQEMVKNFISSKIPVIVFVIQDTKTQQTLLPGPLQLTPESLIPLTVDNIQGALDKINWSDSIQ